MFIIFYIFSADLFHARQKLNSPSRLTLKSKERAIKKEVTLDVEASELRHSKFIVGETEIKENIDIAWILMSQVQ